MTNGGALSLQTSGSLTFTHTGTDTLEIHAPTAGNLEKVVEGTNTGYRILGSVAANHGDIGEKALDLSYQSATSTTTGATGDYSTAMGDNTTAETYGQITIGMYNTTLAGSTTVFDANDRLFVIGNGESLIKNRMP